MSVKPIVGNRWTEMYDTAARGYAITCRRKAWSDACHWRKRLEWLDRKLAEERDEK